MIASLPPELEPFRDKLLQTQMPCIKAISQNERQTTPLESKVGGMPYLLKNAKWPVNRAGEVLYFLAQINFADLPRLDPFPEKGLLQFFIFNDEHYGINFEDGEEQENFRVVFYPDPVSDTSALQNKPVLPEADEDLLPHHPDESYPLVFEPGLSYAPTTDYRFGQIFGQDFFQQFGAREWDVIDAFGKSVNAQSHRVGGYAYFTQDDPRNANDPMILLFQLDSDERMDLQWGDMGVGNFFIREKDLKALDFSKVLYNWDNL